MACDMDSGRRLRPEVVGKIGSTPIGVLVLIALLLIVVRSASLVLEKKGQRTSVKSEERRSR